MSNKKATGKKAKHGENLVQRSRAAVLNALDVVEERGKKISEILADEFEKSPIRFMELASKLMPKEVNLDATIEDVTLSNEERIDKLFREFEARRVKDSRQSALLLDSAGGAAKPSDKPRLN